MSPGLSGICEWPGLDLRESEGEDFDLASKGPGSPCLGNGPSSLLLPLAEAPSICLKISTSPSWSLILDLSLTLHQVNIQGEISILTSILALN